MSNAVRYPHYLDMLKRINRPDACLAIDSTAIVNDCGPSGEKLTLAGWYGTVVTSSKDCYRVAGTFAGRPADAFWRSLWELADRFKSLWIISYRACKVWGLLGIWSELEAGRIILNGRYGTELGKNGELKRKSIKTSKTKRKSINASTIRYQLAKDVGALVMEDPPNIAVFKLAGIDRKITWVDLRNYGLELPEELPAGRPVADWLAQWFIDAQCWLAHYGCGGLSTTASATAFNSFRLGFYSGGILCHVEPRGISLERRAYYGGRCEAFRIGTAGMRCWHVDYRSAYGELSRSSQLPVRLTRIVSSPSIKSAFRYCSSFGTIAEVQLKTEEPAYPCRHNGIVIFPVGTFSTCLCGPELKDALDRDRVLKIKEVAFYEQADSLKTFADRIYSMRCEAERAGLGAIASLAKRLLVGIVGKFGQRYTRWQIRMRDWSDLQWGEWLGSDGANGFARFRSIAGTVWRCETGDYAPEASGALAAWITSAGRVKLLNDIRTAGWGNVVYVDTDSLIVTWEGFDKLSAAGVIREGELGALELRAADVPVEIRGVKYYVEAGQVTCAGMPKGANADYGDGQHYWNFPSPSSYLRRKEEPITERRLVAYARNCVYRHGIVQSDGRVKPICLNQKD